MSNETVSVIITCYNYGRYLARAVDSVLNQTYRDVEVIIVNDGSTDHTDDVAQRYAEDPRVRYVSQKNGGHANAKNTGALLARGAYVAFLDADDAWRVDKLEKQMPLFSRPDVGMVYSRMQFVDQDDRPVPMRDPNPHLLPRRGWVSSALFVDNFVPFSSGVLRRSVLDKIGLMDETIRMGNDWDLWLRASAVCAFEYVDEPLIFYRVGHPGQMSKNLEERQRCSEKTMRKFRALHPSLVSAALWRYAWAYTYNRRAMYFRPLDLRKSTAFFFRALALRPWAFGTIRGILVNAALGLVSSHSAVLVPRKD